MVVGFQLVVDCAVPDRMATFWAQALHYVPAAAPAGFSSWDDYYRSLGVPEDELGEGVDRIEDPRGEGPPIWFQPVPEAKTIKNRLHLDLDVGGGRGAPLAGRRQRIEDEATRLVALGATRLRTTPILEGTSHYAVAMTDPEGNEFDIF